MTIKILGINGSMRENSHSARALDIVLTAAEEHGAKTQLLDLRKIALPMYRPEGSSDDDAAVRDTTEAVNWAEGFVLASPDYHGSMSGAMKNFLDYYWTEFAGKVFGYICASHENGLTAMDHMRTTVRQCYGWSVPYGVAINGNNDADQGGNITNVRIAKRLRMLARDMVVYGTLIKDQFQRDLLSSEAETFAARYRK